MEKKKKKKSISEIIGYIAGGVLIASGVIVVSKTINAEKYKLYSCALYNKLLNNNTAD